MSLQQALRQAWRRLLGALFFLVFASVLSAAPDAQSQSQSQKIRIGVSETQVAYHKGFYREEGIDLEIILMPTNVINNAATLAGQIDINGAVTG